MNPAPQKINLKIAPIIVQNFFRLNDKLDEFFKNWYRQFFSTGKYEPDQEIFKVSQSYFDSLAKDELLEYSDAYFTNFTPITGELIRRGQYRNVYGLWYSIISQCKAWEVFSGKVLHKGTPYYFAAEAALLARDFDSGFVAMDLALHEDKQNRKSEWDKLPANLFLTLNDTDKGQHLFEVVSYMVGFLRDRLDGEGNERGRYKNYYKASRKGSLTYEQLRKKFLDDDTKVDEIKFFFVYSTFKLWHLRVNQKLNKEEKIIAPVIFAQALGPFLIMLEMLGKIKYPPPSGFRNWTFGNIVEKIVQSENWSFPNLGDINKARENDFFAWIDNCLDKSSLEGDFELAYGLRNFTFHKIEAQDKMWNRFTDILQSTWNCFFKIIELL